MPAAGQALAEVRLLRCAGGLISCGEVGSLAVPRARPDRFEGSGQPGLTIQRVSQARAGARALEGSFAPWGDFALEGDVLYAHIPDDVWAALESAEFELADRSLGQLESIKSLVGTTQGEIQGTTLLFSVFVVLINLVIDVIYVMIDPRIRFGRVES